MGANRRPATTDWAMNQYVTNELELASYLKAVGHRLLGADLRGNLVEFYFDVSAEQAVDAYFAGTPFSARELFEAHRSLRALIQQVKQHKDQIRSKCKQTQNSRAFSATTTNNY